jgi:hypothetical protein
MFPRHVIEYMIKTSRFGSVDTAAFRQEDGLAQDHQGVTVMFMDIVGKMDWLRITRESLSCAWI